MSFVRPILIWNKFPIIFGDILLPSNSRTNLQKPPPWPLIRTTGHLKAPFELLEPLKSVYQLAIYHL